MVHPSPPPQAATRALILAGGGAAGNAWQVGLVAGLAAGGVDLTDADLIVGTSAGSTVAAQITGDVPLAGLYSAIAAESWPSRRPEGTTGDARGPLSGPSYLEWSDAVIESAADASDMRRRMGEAALGTGADDGSSQARWRATVASRLSRASWPQQRVVIVAVDAHSGEPAIFDRDSGVDLIDAVAASTSNGFAGAYRIGSRHYLNGGYRRSENADLAVGYDRVLVMSPFGGRTRMPLEWRMDLASQVSDLRAAGSIVETLFPDAGAGDVFDANALDPSTRPAAARGGHAQGLLLAESLREFWLGG